MDLKPEVTSLHVIEEGEEKTLEGWPRGWRWWRQRFLGQWETP